MIRRPAMTAAVRQLLDSFDALPDAEKQQAVQEILRRVASTRRDLPEAALLGAADELFRALDDEESRHARR
jgi:hypothetical protein